MNTLAMPLFLRRPRTLMIAAAGLATAATIFGGAWSASADDSAPAAAPGAPESVEARAGDGAAKVRWIAPESDGGSPILFYVVSSNPEGVSATTGPESLSLRVEGLTNGTEYTFTVAATNEVGVGIASAPSNTVTPMAAPTLEELIERLRSHFQRAIEHVEALASKHAHERATLHLEQSRIRLEQAANHTNEHMELRAQHLRALAEAAHGTPRAEEVQKRVEQAMAEMGVRADEAHKKMAERVLEQQAKIQTRFEQQLEKIKNRAAEHELKLEEKHNKRLEQLKDRFDKAANKDGASSGGDK